ncbi:glutaredoxin family protein [Glaciecola sp. 2405UD65-10]|uniref:glutaredoxin family protein n=1 Tax=Glaciecola sp. 2405UD65-10 TaxID=3397244 RepID=UPI003B5C8000
MKLILYTGPQCSLCDDALDLYHQLPASQWEVSKINIRDSVDLYHLYAVKIPVFKRSDTQEELHWPFDLATLRIFLA